MIKRITFCIFYAAWFPIICISAYVTALIIFPITLFRFIILGDDGKNMDFSSGLFMWAVGFPYELFKIDALNEEH